MVRTSRPLRSVRVLFTVTGLALSAAALSACSNNDSARADSNSANRSTSTGASSGGGGGTGSAGGSSSRSRASGTYADLYQAGQYHDAKDAAEAEMRRARGADRDQAQLIAGLSAQALKQRTEAERLLGPLVNNRNGEIAGTAGASLGVMALERQEYSAAAGLLTDASRRLRGDEAARAAMYAGDAQLGLKRTDQARQQYAVAKGLATSDELKRSIDARLDRGLPGGAPAGGGGFAVQVGVFSSRDNANRAARNAQQALGPSADVRIVPRQGKNGQQLFAVRAGRFASREQAAASAAKVGGQPVALSSAE